MNGAKSPGRSIAVPATALAAGVLAAALLAGCRPAGDRLVASGTLEAESVRVSAQASALVREIAVREGQAVSRGQVLARLDGELLGLQLEEARAGARLARTQLDLLLKGARLEDIRQAEDNLRRAEENLRSARDDVQRMRSLFDSRSVSQKQKEDAESRLKVAEAEYSSAGEALKKVRNPARPEEVEAARIRLEQAEAAERIAARQAGYAEITAPLDGTVNDVVLSEGELAVPGSILFVIDGLGAMELTVYVAEADLGRVSPGQSAEVYVDSFPGTPFPARVVQVSSRAEFTPKNVQTRDDRTTLVFAVKLELDNPEGKLKAGMPADAVLADPAAETGVEHP